MALLISSSSIHLGQTQNQIRSYKSGNKTLPKFDLDRIFLSFRQQNCLYFKWFFKQNKF